MTNRKKAEIALVKLEVMSHDTKALGATAVTYALLAVCDDLYALRNAITLNTIGQQR